MYEELVKRLRERSVFLFPHHGESRSYDADLIHEAADAIEELSKQMELEYQSGFADGQIAANRKKSRWIPVEERLPEAERKSYWVCTDTGYQCECRWTNNRFGIRELDEWGWSIFDIPQYQKVVAWMPLPKPYEPPKEENDAQR